MEKHFNLFTEDASPKNLLGKFIQFPRFSFWLQTDQIDQNNQQANYFKCNMEKSLIMMLSTGKITLVNTFRKKCSRKNMYYKERADWS